MVGKRKTLQASAALSIQDGHIFALAAIAAVPALVIPAFTALVLSLALALAPAAAQPAHAAVLEGPAQAQLTFGTSADLSAQALGDQFVASIAHTSPDGEQDAIACRFKITGFDTCMVVGDGTRSGLRAIDPATQGAIEIPSSVEWEGVSYRVTAIGAYAFGSTASTSCAGLTGVVLPDTITDIQTYAFAYCDGITAIDFPEGLRTVGTYAFYYAEGLTDLVFPASVKSLASFSFSQANGLETVRFAGDAPDVALASFTGSTTIKKVIFDGLGLASTASRFNSKAAGQPTFYYPVTFYASAADAQAGENPIGRAQIGDNAEYRMVVAGLGDDFVYSGAVPDFPQGTNIWRFSASRDRNAAVGAKQSAWAEFSDYRNLARGAVAADDMSYTGGAYTDYIAAPVVTDLEGTELAEHVDYELVYQRQTEAGEWEDLEASPMDVGTYRALARGVGAYSESVSGGFSITVGLGSTFTYLVPAQRGAEPTVPCAFTITSLENGKGTMAVASRSLTLEERSRQQPPLLGAVDASYQGGLVLPETIDLFGNELTLTSIPYGPFHFESNSSSFTARLTAVDIPASVERIGGKAFGTCPLSEVVFRNDMRQTELADDVFSGCSSIRTVVYLGKKIDESRFNPAKFYGSSNVRFYYTVRFYYDPGVAHLADSAEPSAAATFLGQATIADDVLVGTIPDRPTDAHSVFEGAIPAYPDALVDDYENPDRSWYAPAWYYPELDEDADAALRTYLDDSVNAFAEQRQDAFTITDANVLGMKDVYDYTGENVVEPRDISVISPVGGTLERDVDYTLAFQVYDDWEEVWAETDEVVDGGHYRLVVRGAGKYASATRYQAFEFDIRVTERAVGSIVTVDVPLVRADGTQTAVACRFRVTGLDGRRTVEVYGAKSNPAIAGALPVNRGAVVIPSTVRYGGLAYHVEGVSSYAFCNCTQTTGVTLPESAASIGAYAFSGCSSLASFAWPARLTALPERVFENCSALVDVELPEGVEEVGSGAFYGCSSLASLALPSTLATIGARAFAGTTSLESLVIPAGLASYADAFAGSGLKSVSFEGGTQAVCANGFASASSLSSVELPEGLRVIGEAAFQSTALAKLELPASVEQMGAQAFARCSQLRAVVFCGNPNNIVSTGSFANTRNIQAIVYRDRALIDPSDLFALLPDSVGYYYAVTFYASAQDLADGADALGQAYMRQGTRLYTFAAGPAPDGAVYDGAVPALPEGAKCWRFADGRSIAESLDGACSLVAANCDFSDLSTGAVVTAGAYRYTGATVNPITDNTGYVVAGDGARLRRGFDYTAVYERRDAEGNWVPTDDYASPGYVRISATAIEGTGRTGTAVGYYSITRYLAGDTFTADDVNGHAITYQVLSEAGYAGPGRVRVGANGAQAVAEACAGHVVVPAQVESPLGETYDVTEVGREAFYRRMHVTALTLPDTLTAIHSRAFAYERVKTDTATSNLATIVFEGDLDDVSFGRDLFLNCDVVSSLVYGGAKGRLEQINPIAVKPQITLTRYYTARFYEDADALRVHAEPLAKAQLKEGAYAESASATDYFEGSDTVPFPPDGSVWVFAGEGLDGEGRIYDSTSAYLVEIQDGTIAASVDVRAADGTVSQVPCAFTVLSEPAEDGTPGTVAVGRLEDGRPAVAASMEGVLVVPETVRSGERAFTVVEVGLCAFGSSEDALACAKLEGVELPSTVRRIGQGAFVNCAALAHVDGLGASELAEVGAFAFAYCGSLVQMELPGTVRTIGASALRETGLARVVVPASLETLGRQAFAANANLREVVFDGAWSLDLEPLGAAEGTEDAEDAESAEGAAGVGEPGDGTAARGAAAEDAAGLTAAGTSQACQSVLADFGDYAFAECPRLERVAFYLDATNVEVPRDAFSSDAALSLFAFAGAKADLSQVAHDAKEYYTVTYFPSEQGVGAPERAGWRLLEAGQTEGGQPLASAEPVLPEYWEWVRLFDPAEPLDDSVRAYMRPVTFAIDVDPDDAAFDIGLLVDGEAPEQDAARGAHFGERVSISVSTESAFELGGVSVVEADSGEVLAQVDGTEVAFDMPGADVRVDVSVERVLQVSGERATGGEVGSVEFTFEQMERMAQGRSGVSCSYWREGRPYIVQAASAVPLADVVAAAGLRFDAGDALIARTAEGAYVTYTYEDLCESNRCFYPNIAEMGKDGLVLAAPAVALSTAESDLDEGIEGTPSLAECYRLLVGQTEREMLKMRDTAANSPGRIVALTVLYGPEHLQECTVGGLEGPFYYTGQEVCPKPTIVDIDGVTLVEGRDYRLEYADNVEAGVATVTARGMDGYDGEVSATYGIRRAQVLAGADAPATSATVALAAWPDGAAGAVVAGADDYASALSASGLAAALDYPLLLVRGSGLSADVALALAQLSEGASAFEICVVGGTASVSAGAYAQLAAYVESPNYLTRIAGADKYATSLSVYDYGQRRGLWKSPCAVLAGPGSIDAANLAAYAAYAKAPVIVCNGETLSDAAAKRLAAGGFSRVVVAGGVGVVSAEAADSARAALGAAGALVRLSAADVYATSAAVARWEVSQGMTYDGAAIASPARFGEALCAAVMCGRGGSVLLLADDGGAAALSGLTGIDASRLYVAGGGKAVSAKVRSRALSALGWSSAALGDASALAAFDSVPTDRTAPLVRTSIAKARVSVAAATYTGKSVFPAVTVTLAGKTLTSGDDYTLAFANNKNATDAARVTVTGVGAYEGTASATFSIAKKVNPMKVKAAKKKLAAKAGKKTVFKRSKAFKFAKKAKGKVTFAKKKGNRNIVVGKKGKVVVKKACKKGTYKVRVRVSCAGTANYKAKAKVVKLKVRAK